MKSIQKIAFNSNLHLKNNRISLTQIQPVSEIIKAFPTTRYYGSKRKLLFWIFEKLKSLEFNTVLDGFGGTGSVSLLFKAMGKDVTYHDAFLFNTYVGKAVLSNQLAINNKDFIKFVNQVEPLKGVITNNFHQLYYTDLENSWLDGFATKLFSSCTNDQEISLYLYTLFQACLKKRPFNLFHRTNLNLRLNKNVKRKFGNFATWEKKFPELMIKSYQELSNSIYKGRGKIRILKPSDVTDIKPEFDLVYLDPPYINLIEKYNFDDYWKKYHFLEGYSMYKEWQDKIDKNSKLRSIVMPDQFSKWNNKSKFKESLYRLINKHRKSIVVLSYLSNSYPDEKELVEHFESKFSEVSVHSKNHSHALSKNQKRELLIIGKPKCKV